MDKIPNAPETLLEAVRYFSDPGVCLNSLAGLRWPNGVTCPICGSRKVAFLANQRRWKCLVKHPCRQFSVKVKAIFEDSPIGLDKWLPAVWMIVNDKNGISSYEVGCSDTCMRRPSGSTLARRPTPSALSKCCPPSWGGG